MVLINAYKHKGFNMRKGHALAACLLMWASSASFAAPPVNTLTGDWLGRRTDTAILGYDSVAYFTDGKPIKGNDNFVFEWSGAKWKFASADHLALFKSAPQRYAPQYGGYCAYGAAQGRLVKIEPDRWRIVDGRLYLNYDADVQEKWLKDIKGFIKLADDKFPLLLKE